jgi:hypothetical protein
VRKFGIEVEFGGSQEDVVRELRNQGLSQRQRPEGYMGHGEHDWIVKYDGSVSGGGELVGPPLDWDNPEDRAQVTKAFQALADAGCTTHPNAGVHVHIDASDLDGKQVAGVVRAYTKYEDQIYRIATSGWETMRSGARNNYAKRMERSRVERLAKAKTKEQIGLGYYGTRNYHSLGHSHSSRYYGLNLHSWFYRGTIEFRIFNSTMNHKRVLAYITLCMALVQDGRNNKLRSINKVFALGTMHAAATRSSDEGKAEAKKQLHHLSQFLRWENKDTPISKEDLDLITYVWKNSVPQDEALYPAGLGY